MLKGFEFTVDSTSDTLNISGGVAKVSQSTVNTNDHTADDGPAAKTLDLAAFVTQTEASGDMSLSSGTVNHVYLTVDQTANDRPLYRVNSDGTKPSEPSLKLGTVDTSAYTYTYTNRFPKGSFRQIDIRESPTDEPV